MNRNCLSYWFPKLEAAGVPVPRTRMLTMPEECTKAIWAAFDGKVSAEQSASIGAFTIELAQLCNEIDGSACFLRTGQFSGKHNWKQTCYVAELAKLGEHIYELVKMSEMYGMFGELPWDIWVVRELLPTEPLCTLPKYGDFPLVPEVRCFIRGGAIECSHSYWPAGSIRDGFQCRGRITVSCVIQEPVFVKQFITSHQGFLADDSDLGFHRSSPSTTNSALLIGGISVDGHFFRKLDQCFRLPLLDPQIRGKDLTCVGGFRCRNAPVKKRLAADAAGRDNSWDGATESLMENVNGAPMNLLDLDFATEGIAASLSGGLLQVNRKTAIGIEDACTIRDGCWVVFHALHGSIPDGYTQVLMTVIPDEWLPANFDAIVKRAQDNNDDGYVPIAQKVATAFADDGYWSVDLLPTRRGWYVTDCAEGDRSWHWPECPNQKRRTND